MAGPAPAVAAARTAVRTALADLPAGSLVLVACSGGADSLALAAATAFVAPRAGLRAGAVVVDHRLQGGSDGVAREAADACRGLGLAPVQVLGVDVGGSGGPEAAARTARYAALDDAAATSGAAAVLLGHTLDDQAETVLLGLGRGSGGRSLAGMAPAAGRWRRPLLGLRRRDTEAVCTALGLPWAQDPTNSPDGPWRRADGGPLRRSAVRHHVLPALEEALGPGVPEALARTARRLREDEDYLATAAAELGTRAGLAPSAGEGGGTRTDGPGEVSLDVVVLEGAHPALRGRVLHRAATAAGCPPGALTATHVAALEALVTDYRGQGPLSLPGAVTAGRRCGRLTFGRRGQRGAGE
ncbi:tRNA(Ile)-lysidine synthase [Georgenia satyanarayanai]|uniref:tRNA(Ile)-lysidine synthase n=1 Tax=Georgenia satyanarayanai TaxID=860221 RepID=A0A2Y9AIJ8_9MICO|nr:tRNA lysidine(34) synthetase TilS [Georgenia satyanarayanai]PYF99524.1 tRNA(Ile)-lysidine synthase [Georgenia satyanarayanai]SSA42369.1 tRNA(Ile)-lysidine synthase [Georgenia satyanarayanai]